MSFAIYKPDEGMRSDGQRLSVRICRRPEYSAHAGWQNEPAKQHRQCLLANTQPGVHACAHEWKQGVCTCGAVLGPVGAVLGPVA
eukprot:251863-Chlamydomonas_euryale.AAC.13